MALKSGGLSHRHQTTIEYVLDRAAEPGTLCVASGTTKKVAVVSALEINNAPEGSGLYPMGILLNTRESFNYAKELERTQYDTDDIGTAVTLLRDGQVDTNMVVENGGTITIGQPAYLAPDGKVGNANLAGPSGEHIHRVGQFMSQVDSDGFVELRIELK